MGAKVLRSMKDSTVLVTGATGFLGQHLVHALIESGRQVRTMRRVTSETSCLTGTPCEWVTADLEDPHSLRQAVRGCDVVYHAAGLASFFSRRDRRAVYRVNVEGTRHLLEVCLREGVKRVVVTSSIAALGIPPQGAIGNEETLWNWERHGIAYFHAKFLQLLLVESFIQRGLNAVVVMPALVVGPGDHTGCASRTGRLMQAMRHKKVPGYPIGGTTVVSVGDVTRGHLLAEARGRTGERYLLGGAHLPFRSMFERLAASVGVDPPSRPVHRALSVLFGSYCEWKAMLFRTEPTFTRDLSLITAETCYYSSAKAERELGYQAGDPTPAIHQAFEWYLEHGYVR